MPNTRKRFPGQPTKRRRYTRHTQDKVTLPTGSVIHLRVRHDEDRRKVKVTCGKCRRDRFVVQPAGANWQEFTGICRECADKDAKERGINRRRTGVITLASGSVVDLGDRDPSNPYKMRVKCGKCPHTRYADFREGGTGLCRRCCVNAKGQYKYTGNQPHPSGAVIHFDKRDPANVQNVAFTCRKCGEIAKNFVRMETTQSPTWSGLCSSCRMETGTFWKRTHDQALPSKTTIHWGKRKGKKILVTCGLCRRDRWLDRDVIDHGLKRPTWSGYCRTHDWDTLPTGPLLTAKAGAANGKRGRKPLDKAKILAKMKEAIREVRKQVRSDRAVTQERVATWLQLNGDDVGSNAIGERLKSCGIAEPWGDFVESVVRETVPN